jgi:hypothetical protein
MAFLTKRMLAIKDVRLLPSAHELLADPLLAPAAAAAAAAFEQGRAAYQQQHHGAYFAGREFQALLSAALDRLQKGLADTPPTEQVRGLLPANWLGKCHVIFLSQSS